MKQQTMQNIMYMYAASAALAQSNLNMGIVLDLLQFADPKPKLRRFGVVIRDSWRMNGWPARLAKL